MRMEIKSILSFILGGIFSFGHPLFAQLSGGNVFLQGNFVEIGIAQNGSWGAGPVPAGYHPRSDAFGGTSNLNVVYDYGHDGWTTGTPAYFGDYIFPGTPFEGWAMQANGARSDAFYSMFPSGVSFGNAMPAVSSLTGSNTAYNVVPGIATCGYPVPPSAATGVWTGNTTGSSGGLNIVQTTSVDADASWVNITTVFRNTTSAAIPGVYYWRTCDPDDDVTYSGNYTTENHISYQNDADHRVFVGSHGLTNTNAFLGIGTKDCRAKAMIYQLWSPFPGLTPGNSLDRIYNENPDNLGLTFYGLGNTTTDDWGMGLIYNIGTIAAGDSAIISYAYILTDSSGLEKAFPEPQMVVSCVPTMPSGPAPAPTYDTFRVCEHPGTTTLPVYIKYGDTKCWSWSKWTWAPATGLVATTGLNNTINLNALSGPTTFTITGTDNGVGMNSCSQRVFYLTVIPCFNATSNSPDDDRRCVDDTLKLTAHGDSTDATYIWHAHTVGGPVVGTAQTISIPHVTMADTGWYYVIKTVGTSQDTVSTHVLLKPKPVLNLTTNGPVCSGNGLQLTSSPDSVGETWSWSGPLGFNSTASDPLIAPAITGNSGTYKVIASFNGCIDSAFINAVVDSTPEFPLLGSNSPVCSGDTLFLTSVENTVGVIYNWSGPLTFTSTLANPSILNVPIGAAGTYRLIVKLGGCSDTATTAVVINPTPLPVLGTNSPVCSGNPLNLTSSGIAGSDFSWTGPNTFTSTSQSPTINPATTAATGNYSVVVTLNGCSSDTISIYAAVDTTPQQPVVSTNSPGPPGASICQGDTLFLFAATATAGSATYAWSGPDAFTSTQQNPVILNATPAASGFYTVTVSVGACTASAIVVATVTATPPLTASVNNPICTGLLDTIFLQATSGPGAQYTWSGPYVFISAAQNPFRTPVIAEYGGVYHVSVLLNGCTNTVSVDVNVHQTPDGPWVKWLTYCQFYDAPPLQAGGSNILWYTSSAGGIGTATPPVPSTAALGWSFYYVNQTVEGCPGPIDSIKVQVNPKPVVTVLEPAVAICPRDSVVLTAVDADAVAYYHWIPSMYVSDTSSAVTVIRPETNMFYSVVATNQYSCTDTATVTVTVHPGAVISLEDSVTLYQGETYQMHPESNCTSFRWTPSGGLSNPYIINPVASPEISTRYFLYGITDLGCTTKDSIDVIFNPEAVLAMPNAFAPGSGANNVFRISKRGIAQLRHFRIYDRWGIMVFDASNIDEGWDGTYRGAPQPVGVYVYEVSAISSGSGKEFIKKGNITLLR